MSSSPPAAEQKKSSERKHSRRLYWSKEGRDGPWDYIVIGSGMGGMSAAALLTKLGHRVLVLEQHYVPGGFTHTFTRKHYRWDVGVHAVGEVTHHTISGRLLSHLTDGRLEWASLGPVYDEFHFPGDFRIDFPDSPAQYEANLCEAFPDDAVAIRRYIDYAGEVAKTMPGYYFGRALPGLGGRLLGAAMGRGAQRFLSLHTKDVVTELSSNERLRTIFTAQWGYYGSPPSRSSFAMQALVVRHFIHGGYYPVGGSQKIAETLLRTVAEGGGWTRIRADVDEILIEGGRATGVRLQDGEEIRARRGVISAAGVMSTLRKLLPESARNSPWAQKIGELNPAPAHVCLYLGFKGDIRQAGASGANKWLCNTWDPEQGWWHAKLDQPLPQAPILYCSFPSLKDPEHDPGPELRHTGEVVTFVPWDTFADWRGSRWKRRAEDYDRFKEQMTELMLAQLFESMPQLKPMVAFAELSTPLTTDHFVRPMAGSIYGIEPTPARFENRFLRPKSPIPGLYFGGSEVASVGVMGAMLGGILAVGAAEPLATIRQLRKL